MLKYRIFQLQTNIKRRKEELIEELNKNKPNNVILINSLRRYLELQAQLKYLEDMESDLEKNVASMIQSAVDKVKEKQIYTDIGSD